jgi:hypothetical protein
MVRTPAGKALAANRARLQAGPQLSLHRAPSGIEADQQLGEGVRNPGSCFMVNRKRFPFSLRLA